MTGLVDFLELLLDYNAWRGEREVLNLAFVATCYAMKIPVIVSKSLSSCMQTDEQPWPLC
jgi:hypothetical protein